MVKAANERRGQDLKLKTSHPRLPFYTPLQSPFMPLQVPGPAVPGRQAAPDPIQGGGLQGEIHGEAPWQVQGRGVGGGPVILRVHARGEA